MGTLVIKGGTALKGEITVGGAKNAALPVLAACVLNGAEASVENCPDIADIGTAVEILRELGCSVKREGAGGTVTVNSAGLNGYSVSEGLAKKMRASVIFSGALLARTGRVQIYCPGGCKLGERPINFHLEAFRRMGVSIEETGDFIDCKADRLEGVEHVLPFPSVGATENIMLAAVFAEGLTTIKNAAREPEIIDLQNALNAFGGRVSGAGGYNVAIEGVNRLRGGVHRVVHDRIAAATYLCAAAATGGAVSVRGALYGDMVSVADKLSLAGCELEVFNGGIRLSAPARLKSLGEIVTAPHPGFPTDCQSQMTAVAALSKGETLLRETIFERRTLHIPHLKAMGADITVLPDGRSVAVRGVRTLNGRTVKAEDLRGGAALAIAGLAAQGLTVVENFEHIERGYERFDENLRELGADVRVVE